MNYEDARQIILNKIIEIENLNTKKAFNDESLSFLVNLKTTKN